MSTMREKHIEQLIYATAHAIVGAWQYEPPREYTRADLEDDNRRGYTLETMSSDPSERRRGTVVRVEGVRFDTAELDEIWRRAVALTETREIW